MLFTAVFDGLDGVSDLGLGDSGGDREQTIFKAGVGGWGIDVSAFLEFAKDGFDVVPLAPKFT